MALMLMVRDRWSGSVTFSKEGLIVRQKSADCRAKRCRLRGKKGLIVRQKSADCGAKRCFLVMVVVVSTAVHCPARLFGYFFFLSFTWPVPFLSAHFCWCLTTKKIPPPLVADGGKGVYSMSV